MRRGPSIVLIALMALTVFAGPAAAQPTLDQVVDAVDQDGFYAEPGADVDADLLAAALDGIDEVVVVVLADDDPDGAEFAANQVRDSSRSAGAATVLVITPGEVAASQSDRYTDAEIGDALDATLDTFDAGGTTTDAVRAFTGSLRLNPAPQPTAGSTSDTAAAAGDGDGDGGGGAGGFLIFLLIVAAVIGGLFWWAKRRATKVDIAEIDRAKAEIRQQLEKVAHDIVEHEHTIDLSENSQAIDHYREASATYQRVAEEVEETQNLLDLAEMNDDVDLARWQLEAALALAEGRDVPAKPEPEKPAACFFDPTHKPGTELATIKTSAGDKEVRVCQACADKLEKGQRPEPRMIDVGGKRVPAAKAPKSHGGLGMGGLSIFEIILGGLGAIAAGTANRPSRSSATPRRSTGNSVGIDWGDMLPKRRPSAGVFGPDRQPSRPTGLPRTKRSSPRSRTRTRLPSRPSQSAGRSRSRTRTRSRTRGR